jgi:sugar/nucleoside kinase (ribokinase family)/phosphoglycolate phosphatase-like HAD superfamily hydrolase
MPVVNMDIENVLKKFKGISVAVIGDFCVDAYLVIQDNAGEVSVETGLKTRSVREMRFELGGAANIAKNLAVLGAGSVFAYGIVGDDVYGREMLRQFDILGVDRSGLIVQKSGWSTNTYTKPYRDLREEPRIDIGNFNVPDTGIQEEILVKFETTVSSMDAVIVNQQLVSGISTESFRKRLVQIIERCPDAIFISDSRAYSDDLDGALRKINLREAAQVLGLNMNEPVDDDACAKISGALFERWGQTVFLTRGENGIAVRSSDRLELIRGINTAGAIDPVGAGDAFAAGVAACLGSGIGHHEAAQFGNFCAAVTVTQRFTTGSPFPDQVQKIGCDPDYIFNPILAGDHRRAVRFEDTEIEIVSEKSCGFPAYAIFDHDGTISTLREGWEAYMRQIMIESVSGGQLNSIPISLYNSICLEVDRLIELTTGMRTIEQMRGLLKIIGQFGILGKGEVLTEADYKRRYLERLGMHISRRLDGLAKGIFSPDDFTVKGSISFLRELNKRGVILYLASGTDEDYVRKEAVLLGYAELFNGGIFGAVDSDDEDPKKKVLKTILDKIEMGNQPKVAVFGDGPVEMREAKKRDVLAVGVASDEVRRFGFNYRKRSRLIRAGADVIIPDFSDVKLVFSALKFGI